MFAHFAAQRPQVADRPRAHRQAQFDALGIGLGHKKREIASVVKFVRRHEALEFRSDRADVGRRIEMEKDGRGQLLADPRPILERVFEKAHSRHHQHSLVPGPDRDEAHADFFHAPDLAVELDHIADA